MKKYALIKNDISIKFENFDNAPTLAANKGAWVEVNDTGAPEYDPETEVCTASGKMYYGKWKIEYTVRDKTPLELWKYPDYTKKINIPLLSIPTYAGLGAMLLAQGLPTVQLADGTIDVYLNYILPAHQSVLEADNEITIYDKPS
jgi:hypothetical protein